MPEQKPEADAKTDEVNDFIKIVEDSRRRKDDSEINQQLKELMAERNKPVPPPPPPPPPTERQRSQTELEMARGAARVKFFEEQQKLRTPPEPDKTVNNPLPVSGVFREEKVTGKVKSQAL